MRALPLTLLPLCTLLACGDGKDPDVDPEETGDTDDTAPAALCEEPTVPACLDAMIMDLSLHTEVSDGAVTTTTEGTDFVTVVDATAGGSRQATNNPWVYVAFGEEGATKVEIDDETAAEESMDWHLALRRYNVRANGGDGGPACTGVTEASGDYASLTSAEGASFQLEDFYDDACTLQMDQFGMTADLLMNGWWNVPMDGSSMCVQTTMQPYLIQVPSGRVLKLVVEAYYSSGQEACNDGETSGWDDRSSGTITLRWAWLT